MFRLKSSNRWIAVLACFALSSCQILSSADDIAASVSADDKPRSGLSLDLLRAKDPQSKIGARGHPKVLAANGGAFESQKLDEMLAVIVGRLITHSNDPDRVFEITVLDSASVNAFVTIPHAVKFYGLNLYTQGAAFAPGINPLGVLSSNGVEATLGI